LEWVRPALSQVGSSAFFTLPSRRPRRKTAKLDGLVAGSGPVPLTEPPGCRHLGDMASSGPRNSGPGPSDNEAYRFPVSVKGVVIRQRRVILLKNERNEWELPGGKLELHETPAECVAREVREELQLRVEATRLLDSWVYTIAPGVHVLILTFGCRETHENTAAVSAEHERFEWFSIDEVDSLHMPEGYKASIRRWASDY
jgi:mutator protein MutT